MTFGMTAIAVSAVMYVIVGFSCIRQKDQPHALMWFSYAMANIGLLWYEIKKISGG
jgi:NADH:ubiquinone oxidoreductase subunit 6 (subunit J)